MAAAGVRRKKNIGGKTIDILNQNRQKYVTTFTDNGQFGGGQENKKKNTIRINQRKEQEETSQVKHKTRNQCLNQPNNIEKKRSNFFW